MLDKMLGADCGGKFGLLTASPSQRNMGAGQTRVVVPPCNLHRTRERRGDFMIDAAHHWECETGDCYVVRIAKPKDEYWFVER